MKHDILGGLTEQDWEILRRDAETVTYQNGEVIVAEGTTPSAIYILLKGYATVEASSQTKGICLNQVGPGEILGEVSFIEAVGATASIIAEGEAEVQVISEAKINALLEDTPGFGTRFYKSLAITLAERLRRSTAKIATLDQAWANSAARRQLPHAEQTRKPLIPEPLLAQLEQFRSALLAVDQRISEGQDSRVAQKQVVAVCDGLFNCINQQLNSEAQIAAAEPSPDPAIAPLEAGIGDYVFREVFPLFMRSATIACCYSRGIHYANDYLLGEIIAAEAPAGDSDLGVEIDAWFLSRPFCHAYRQSQQFLEAQIVAMAQSQPHLTRVMTLAAGNARELLNALMAHKGIYGLCLDNNSEALDFNARHVQELDLTERTTVLQGRLPSLLAGQDQLALPPQHIIYGLDLCDRWETEPVIQLLDWVYDHLAPGGRAIFTNLQPNFPDDILLKHVLNWQRCYRTAADWRELLAQSRFNLDLVELNTDAAPGMLLAIATKSI